MKDLLNDDIRLLMRKDNCFDFIRYFLAFSVIIVHFCVLTGIDQFWFMSGMERVRSFFILSGFLVFYSYIKRPNVKEYAGKRFRRIYPAYFFVIIVCVVAGIFATSLPISEYLLSKQTYQYLLANLGFMNFLQPNLPGVFENNIYPVVNGALWTLKVEVMFYISVPFVYFLLKRYNKLAVMLGLLILSALYYEFCNVLYERSGNFLFLQLRKQFGGQFIYFFSGGLILLYFNLFQKYVKYIFPLAIVIYIFREDFIVFHYLEPLALASILIGFAYNFKYLNFLRKYDNISYGIYLFHFPVIQVVINYGLPGKNIYLAFFVVLIVTVLLSILSWKLIEKPIIMKRKKLPQ